MAFIITIKQTLKRWRSNTFYRDLWQYIHMDIPLLLCLFLLCIAGLFTLYSASNQNLRVIEFQVIHYLLAFIILFISHSAITSLVLP
jgi:cell division protein FtsW (lipid II flippase)